MQQKESVAQLWTNTPVSVKLCQVPQIERNTFFHTDCGHCRIFGPLRSSSTPIFVRNYWSHISDIVYVIGMNGVFYSLAISILTFILFSICCHLVQPVSATVTQTCARCWRGSASAPPRASKETSASCEYTRNTNTHTETFKRTSHSELCSSVICRKSSQVKSKL